MNRNQTKFCNLLALWLLSAAVALANDPGVLAERRKSVVKLYDVTARNDLMVDNQFGHVKVNLWDRDEIRVDITILATASRDDQAQRYLDGVEIVERRTGDQISLKTTISNSGFGGDRWASMVWSQDGRKENRSGLQIDYTISMPRTNALTVRNRFGNTTIPVFRAPLTVVTRFGNFYATDLKGDKVDIDVQYGTGDIREMENGKLDFQYSTLTLDKANVIMLNNKFGKMQIGEVNRIEGNIGYSGAKIGTLKETCKVRLDYSGGFRIDQLSGSADRVDIHANFSSVVLPLSEENNGHFDVTVQHGNFRYPSDNSRFILKTQPTDDDRRLPYRSTRQYSGQIGKGNGPKVRVVSLFGDVKFQ